jgi:hypothetical protein
VKQHYKLLLALLCFCAVINACKLDPPIFPQTPPTSTGTTGATGTTGVTESTATTINLPQLNGRWLTKKTTAGSFNLMYNPQGFFYNSDQFYNFMDYDAPLKKAVFTMKRNVEDTYTYTTIADKGKTYITFNADPFFRTDNFRIEITSISATEMTWNIIDTKVVDIGVGVKGYKGEVITFYK